MKREVQVGQPSRGPGGGGQEQISGKVLPTIAHENQEKCIVWYGLPQLTDFMYL